MEISQQMILVRKCLGFIPTAYIAKDGMIVGFIQNSPDGYIATRLDDENIASGDYQLPWQQYISKTIEDWAGTPEDYADDDDWMRELDYLWEEITNFTGCVVFCTPQDYKENLEMYNRIAKYRQKTFDKQIEYLTEGAGSANSGDWDEIAFYNRYVARIEN